MQELICINDSYTEDFLKVFNKYNIKFPKKNEIVTLLRIEKLPRINKIGFIVQPYENQFIKGINFGIESEKEVSFDYKRFTKLDSSEFTEKEIKELIKEFKNIDKLIEK